MRISNYQNEFKKIIKRGHFIPEVNPIRKVAFDQLIQNGLPSKKWSDLRFTNFKELNKNIFRISEIKDTNDRNFDSSSLGIDNSYKIIFHNGHFQNNISTVPEGVELLSNLEYCNRNRWNIHQPNKSPYDLLNTAFMDGGMFLTVKNNVEITDPIFLIFIFSGEDSLMMSPRLHIELNQSSSVSLFEYHTKSNCCHMTNLSTFCSLKENSNLNHIRLQLDSTKSININNIHIEQEQHSNYHFSHFAIGSSLGSININTHLKGEAAECHLNGLTLTNNYQHIDTHIFTNHNFKNCTSTQNFKTILKDYSSGVFNGKVTVQKNAQKTDSNQSNKNLILSKNAKMNSNPQLIIHADDVRCSHGSSTGEIDPDSLFYMRSRGLDEDTATLLLINGFAAEILETIKNKKIQKFILKQFKKWMQN